MNKDLPKLSVKPSFVQRGPVLDVLATWRPMGFMKDDLGHFYIQLNDPRNIEIFSGIGPKSPD